jgi:hypothetical protein
MAGIREFLPSHCRQPWSGTRHLVQPATRTSHPFFKTTLHPVPLDGQAHLKNLIVLRHLFYCTTDLIGPGSHYRGFMITLRQTTVGRTPLYEWSARRTHLYLTTHNNHNLQISMHPVGFEFAIPASEWPQNHTLDRAVTGIGRQDA